MGTTYRKRLRHAKDKDAGPLRHAKDKDAGRKNPRGGREWTIAESDDLLEGRIHVELPVRIADVISGVSADIEELTGQAGLAIMHAVMEAEVEHLVGAKGRHDPNRTTSRWGAQPGYAVLGGSKVTIDRPRIREAGGKEVPLRSYGRFQSPERRESNIMRMLVNGISTRRYPPAACSIVLGLYIVALWGQKRMWRRYPWMPQIRDQLRRFQMRRNNSVAGRSACENLIVLPKPRWPFAQLAPQKLDTISPELSLALSLLCGWWRFVGEISVNEPIPERDMRMMMLGCAVFLPLLRWVVYRIGFSPPISLYARFRTGRFWIAGYDYLLARHLGLTLAGVALVLGLEALRVPPPLRHALCVSAGVFVLLTLRPSPATWWLTGHHCIASWAPTESLRQPSGDLRRRKSENSKNDDLIGRCV